MQKTLIVQVEVGGVGGYVYRSDQSPKAYTASKLFSKLTPTVERYCKNNGYDYLLNLSIRSKLSIKKLSVAFIIPSIFLAFMILKIIPTRSSI